MLRVSIQTGKRAPEVLEFLDAATVSFGRAPDNDIVLPASYVSRSHGRFERDSDGWHVADCGSQVGLVLVKGDDRVEIGEGGRQRHRLTGGESLEIMTTRLVVEFAEEESSSLGDDQPLNNVAPVAFSQMIDVGSLEKKLQKESKKLELLLELAEDLNRMTVLDDVLRRIGKAVFEALKPATHFSVYTKAADGSFLPHFGSLRGGAELDRDEVSVSQSILRLVLEHEMALVFHGSGDGESPSNSMVLHNIASSMAVPLRGERGIVGVMQIDNRATAEPFSEANLDLIVVLAHSAALAVERARLQMRIQNMFEGFIDASVTAIECRDPTTSGHSRRVARLSVDLAEQVNRLDTGRLASFSFTNEQVNELAYAALLHDFGKVGVPERVLVKANRLFPEQRERLEQRFEYIRLAHRVSMYAKYLKAGEKVQSPDEALALIDRSCAAFDGGLRKTLGFLVAVDEGGRLDDRQRSRLERIARTTFVDGDGNRRQYLEDDELEALGVASGTLTKRQREAIETHVMASFRFLRQIPWPGHLAEIPDIVLAHHEKLDGTGYPRGLAAEDIPIQARLLSVVDIFDAITASDRPYRAAMPVERGLDVLRAESEDGRIDTDLVELFIGSKLWEHLGSMNGIPDLSPRQIIPAPSVKHSSCVHTEADHT